MNIHRARAAFSWTLPFGLLALAAALPGCGSSISGICDTLCDCTGCSEREYEECVDSGEDSEKEAEDAGCADQFDNYLACFEEEIECHDSAVSIDGCESEATELAKCGAPGFGSSCDVALAHLADCGLDVGGGQDSCEGASDCLLGCVIAAPCSAFDGSDQAATDTYVNCISACDGVDQPPQPGGGTGGSAGTGGGP